MTPRVDINFKISGPSLSFLFYDCERSVSNQVGFLIGEKQDVLKKTISDSESSGEKMDTTVSITAPMPVGLPFTFSNNIGRVDYNKLKKILGHLEKDVVGWYSFRRNSRHIPLLRETILHQELCQVFTHIPPLCFTFCIITMCTNSTGSTHSYRYTFYRDTGSGFESVSTPVSNLGQALDSTYKESPLVTESSKYLQEIVHSLRPDSQALQVIGNLESALRDSISELVGDAVETERNVEKLLSEVDRTKQENGQLLHCKKTMFI